MITHGTDILEETAYLLARTLPFEVPVAMTGAMRTSSDQGWDGPANLAQRRSGGGMIRQRRAWGDGGLPREDFGRSYGSEDPRDTISTPSTLRMPTSLG